ncbi:hypothetical protein STEG23_005272, partial [Scotinomys teguina]
MGTTIIIFMTAVTAVIVFMTAVTVIIVFMTAVTAAIVFMTAVTAIIIFMTAVTGALLLSRLPSPTPQCARTSSTILNKYGESRQPCLVPDFNGIALSFYPFNLMLAVGLLQIAFIMFRFWLVLTDVKKPSRAADKSKDNGRGQKRGKERKR